METTEKVVEAYCRYIKGWATIPNIKCSGQYEIDLLAINPLTLERYHVESGISISGGYSHLTAKPFSTEELKQRLKQAGQRRTLGYFAERKFGAEEIIKTLKNYGFYDGNYSRIIVTWGWEDEAESKAKDMGIILWDFRDILQELAQTFHKQKTYFIDDTLRTLQLFALASRKKTKGLTHL
jgi:hypothetical protein